jgi:arylsulfatase A-like enzyme
MGRLGSSRINAGPWLCLLVLVGPLAGCAPEHDRPDVVLIVVDTLRRDHLSPYGSERPTPNVERLADRGQVFTNVHASYHQTTMSMGALFTGRTPSLESEDPASPLPWTGRNWCGMSRFRAGLEDTCIPQALATLAERLREAGYWTLGIATNRLLWEPAGYAQGFDRWIELGARQADLPRPILSATHSGRRVHEALEAASRDLPVGPLFLYVHYMDVHDWQVNFESYAEAVAHVDTELGMLLDLLEERGLLEDAVVFLTSDHGEILDEEHEGYLSEGHIGNPSFQPVLEIPLIVAPARFENVDRFLRSEDIPGLIAQAAGIGWAPDPSPVLHPDELFVSERAFLTYRKGRFKSSFHRKKLDKWALYDLETDPGEKKNLIQGERDVALEHLERVAALARGLAVERSGPDEMSEEDASRLRALGYLE